MLSVNSISCRRGDRLLFSALSFSLAAGEVVHCTGHNGSGKTSLLRIMAGLATPEDGLVLWNDRPISTLREEFSANLLYLGHAAALKDDLTAAENLAASAALAGQSVSVGDVSAALRKMGLTGREDLLAQVLSAGQRRRVNLARLVLPNPPALWILDEPFTALDTRAQSLLEEIISGHVASGGMLAYTTHQPISLGQGRLKRLHLEGGKGKLC